MTDQRPLPDCTRCGQPIEGPRTPGAALLDPETDTWACGHCATTTEHSTHLRRLLNQHG